MSQQSLCQYTGNVTYVKGTNIKCHSVVILGKVFSVIMLWFWLLTAGAVIQQHFFFFFFWCIYTTVLFSLSLSLHEATGT